MFLMFVLRLEILNKFEQDGKLKWVSDFIISSQQETVTGNTNEKQWLTLAQIAKEENLSLHIEDEKEVLLDLCEDMESRRAVPNDGYFFDLIDILFDVHLI